MENGEWRMEIGDCLGDRVWVAWGYDSINGARGQRGEAANQRVDTSRWQAALAWKKPALSPAEGPVLGRVQGRKVAQHSLFHGGAARREACWAGLAQAGPAWKKPALSPAEGPLLGRVQGRKVAQHRLCHGGAAQREACCMAATCHEPLHTSAVIPPAGL
jgi:hypothetical protein